MRKNNLSLCLPAERVLHKRRVRGSSLWKIITVILSLCCNLAAKRSLAQEKLELQWHCSYVGEPLDRDIYGFRPDRQARAAMDRILRHNGLYSALEPVFDMRAANVPNAVATLLDGNRPAILYSQEFMDNAMDVTRSDWAAVSILAHEIAHHLLRHDLSQARPRDQRRVYELGADHYSGFILQRMGATISDAQAVINAMGSVEGTADYPPRSARLAAIRSGWTEGREMTISQPSSTSPPVHASPSSTRVATPSAAPTVTTSRVTPSPGSATAKYVFYGIANDAGWFNRNFERTNASTTGVPEVGDTVRALGDVYLRSDVIKNLPERGWTNSPSIGIATKNQVFRVVDVIRIPDNDDFVWVRVNSL